MPTEFDDWFVREILVHERALALFLQRNWPHRDELHDLRQEAYARVYEAAARGRPTAPKAFLFATARHLMTDRLRRSRVVSIEPVGDFESSNVYLIDEVSPERWMGTRQALTRLAEALDRLPDRCREVVWLRRVEELPQKGVAERLGISEKTVEKHLAKGMRLIADYLYGGDAARPAAAMDEDDGQGRRQQAD
ncbi:MAG TPA: sigma-70 family RNA polymerase sigma factor [Pseudoxanthomonas sp.]|nr:sigma-70 family RNA polymerase sigma factor [Pseudoxanthomonas sp.]